MSNPTTTQRPRQTCRPHPLWTLLLWLAIPAASVSFSSCRTVAPPLNYAEVVQAAGRLGMEIDYNDNHALYLQAASWLGVPYRNGGTTRRGIDCSGLSVQLYQGVYGTKLPRSTTEQLSTSKRVRKGALREGDLVFFSSSKSPRRVAHVGIYLKDGRFVHASSSRGVMVSNLNETYYRKHWMRGGRIIK